MNSIPNDGLTFTIIWISWLIFFLFSMSYKNRNGHYPFHIKHFQVIGHLIWFIVFIYFCGDPRIHEYIHSLFFRPKIISVKLVVDPIYDMPLDALTDSYRWCFANPELCTLSIKYQLVTYTLYMDVQLNRYDLFIGHMSDLYRAGLLKP
jgi:hypothetical protein